MVAMAGCLLYTMASLIALYITYPVSVSVAVIAQHRLTFPAVTLCNLNPVKQSALSQFMAGNSGGGQVTTSAQVLQQGKKKRRRRAAGGTCMPSILKILDSSSKR